MPVGWHRCFHSPRRTDSRTLPASVRAENNSLHVSLIMSICLFLSLLLSWVHFSLFYSFPPPLHSLTHSLPLSLSLCLPRAFVWLYFRHQTWQFVTVDTIRSDLQFAPSLWTLRRPSAGTTLAETHTHTREREWKNNDEYLAQEGSFESPPEKQGRQIKWDKTAKMKADKENWMISPEK